MWSWQLARGAAGRHRRRQFCWRLPEPGDAAAQVRRERLVVLRRERLVVLYGPIRLVTELAVLWTVAALLFAFVNLQFGPRLGTPVGETILLGGVGHPGVFLAEQQEARTG